MINRKRLVIFIVIAFLLSVTVFLLFFHILAPNKKVITIAGDSARVYTISRDRLLLVWRDEVFFIHPESRWVGKSSDYRNSLLGKVFWPKSSSIVFWPRGSYESVPLGDEVKGDPREGFVFVQDKIQIRSHFYADDKNHELTIKRFVLEQ